MFLRFNLKRSRLVGRALARKGDDLGAGWACAAFDAMLTGIGFYGLQVGERVLRAVELELVEATCLRHHPAFEAADEVVVMLDGGPQPLADIDDMTAHCGEAAVELAA